MKSQCRLIRLFEQSPRPVPHGSREHNPKRVLFTHENKGKKYPYQSQRQLDRHKHAWVVCPECKSAIINSSCWCNISTAAE